ncbi:MAG: hypothetical protein A2V66_07095 [Ignavibacteria bacterium RBG_13_36_8]|nr:MAG: hypothetical protein A2V66_07095 [Ignavibacteria bacterium RBG_13_36_8]
MGESKEDVREYLNKLIRQLVFIKSLDKQLKLISEWESPQRIIALNIGSHFFRLVTYSFKRTIMIELCKLFSDKEQKSIIDFLNYVKKHAAIIEPSRFNPESQTREKTSQDEYMKVIDGHITLIESKKDIISNLKGHRDKLLVHSDAKYFDDSKILYMKYPLDDTEVDDLIATAKDILECHHVYLLKSHLEIEVHSTSDVDTVLWHTRGFKRVWEDKRATFLYPYLYKLDDYEEKLKEQLSKGK